LQGPAPGYKTRYGVNSLSFHCLAAVIFQGSTPGYKTRSLLLLLTVTLLCMIEKRVLIPDRVRKVPASFSWVDHRVLREGYLEVLLPEEMLLYFFLILVGDRHGLSFYATRSMAKILKVSAQKICTARRRLCEEGLIAYQKPLYQVLSLPESATRRKPAEPALLGDILRRMATGSCRPVGSLKTETKGEENA